MTYDLRTGKRPKGRHPVTEQAKIETPADALRKMAASWLAYVKTPDNDYSDGVADGLAEAAGDLGDWLTANAPAAPDDIRADVAKIVDYNWNDEEHDYSHLEPGNENDVYPALVRIRAWLNAPRNTVYVLSYSHQHGEDITAYASEAVAAAAAAGIAREYWEDAAGNVNAPDGFPATCDELSDADVTRMYFEVMADRESYVIEAAEVHS